MTPPSRKTTITLRVVKLADLNGFVFDLDGCIWTGASLLPGVEAGMVTVWLATPEAKAEIGIRSSLRVASHYELLARIDDELL